jgi:transmembrane sensor
MDRLQYLLTAYFKNNITKAEETELLALVEQKNTKEAVLTAMESLWEQLENDYRTEEIFDREKSNQILQSILLKKKGKLIKLHPWRLIAAAAFIGIMAVTGWLVLRDRSVSRQNIVAHVDIKAPSTNRATITLANGQKIYLDSAANGNLAMLGNVQLVKLADGEIVYSGTSDKVEYNTITNPRGSKVIDMAFVDGSHVWLNAGSSVTYPVPFQGNERKVKIDGEAYFEITHDASKPFKVSKNDMEVTVLGTHFNINAYDDEPGIKVTLLEGSVKVNKAKNEQVIKPGEQAIIKDDIKVETGIDTEEVMAWKNGKFEMRGVDAETLMRQIARWYDVDVVKEGVLPQNKFGGSIGREVNLSALLEALKEYGVKSRLEERKLIIE